MEALGEGALLRPADLGVDRGGGEPGVARMNGDGEVVAADLKKAPAAALGGRPSEDDDADDRDERRH